MSTVEEAAAVISELKGKFRSQGHQIITYRRKLRQQVGGQPLSEFLLIGLTHMGCPQLVGTGVGVS